MDQSNPFAPFKLPLAAKTVVPFLHGPPEQAITLPIEQDGVRILKVMGSEVLTAYVPGSKGPVFMRLLERNFGTSITTRTLEAVRKCAWA